MGIQNGERTEAISRGKMADEMKEAALRTCQYHQTLTPDMVALKEKVHRAWEMNDKVGKVELGIIGDTPDLYDGQEWVPSLESTRQYFGSVEVDEVYRFDND